MTGISALLTVFTVFCCCSLRAQTAGRGNSTDNFFRELMADTAALSEYCDPDELTGSLRLGVAYAGVKNKFLISYDVDTNVKEKINSGEYKYELRKQDTGDPGYSKIIFTVSGLNYTKDFYFHNGKFISPASFFTRSWKRIQTRYFNFIISDTSRFNSYSSSQLEDYTEGILSLLKIKESDKELLRSQKINYILCSDSAEIRRVTGFNTRGIFLMAGDAVISTFSCHFHELAHLLMNFRIRNNELYCLPFLQEGFASASGGRGGIARNIILDIGYFLQRSGYIRYNSVLGYKDFFSEDASITYPAAALYSLFLMKEYGIEPYIELYRQYCGNYEFVSGLAAGNVHLPAEAEFETFLKSFKGEADVLPDSGAVSGRKILSGGSCGIYDADDYYLFRLKGGAALKGGEAFPGYRSFVFEELYPGVLYAGEKYLITAGKREIKIYNLLTNNLRAAFSTGFNLDLKTVPERDGYFQFRVKKDIFSEGMENLKLTGLK